MMRNTLFMIVLVGAVGYLAHRGVLPFSGDVVVDISAPTTLYAPSGGQQNIIMPVVVHLENKTAEPVNIEAPTPCDIFRWIVLTPENEFVQSTPETICAQMVMTGTIDPGFRLDEQYDLHLDPHRVKPGRRYRLLYRFWGYENHHDFSVKLPGSPADPS